MKIYHTSANKIEKIEQNGSFGSVLFFSKTPYCTGRARFTYEMEVDEDEVVGAYEALYLDAIDYSVIKKFIAELQDYLQRCFNVEVSDEDTLTELLFEEVNTYDFFDDSETAAETGWYIQQLLGEMARDTGYKAFVSKDEQGQVFIADMYQREDELKLVED